MACDPLAFILPGQFTPATLDAKPLLTAPPSGVPFRSVFNGKILPLRADLVTSCASWLPLVTPQNGPKPPASGNLNLELRLTNPLPARFNSSFSSGKPGVHKISAFIANTIKTMTMSQQSISARKEVRP